MGAPETIQVTLPFAPRPHQAEAHERRKRFSVLVWHRRSGKTVFAVMELILAALSTEKERGRFGYVAPFRNQAKTNAWDYLKHYLRGVPGVDFDEGELAADLPNGARIRIFGADNPDAMRGQYFDGLVLDEIAQMRPEVWGEVLRPTLADRGGWALFIGTPKGTNLFSELYYDALRDPTWYADLRRASDTDAIPKDEVEQARREMSAAQFAQEFDCDFAAASEDALIGLTLALNAQKRWEDQPPSAYAAKVLGVDVARHGNDRTVFFRRQGLVAFPPKVFRDKDTMAVAALLSEEIEEWEPHATFIDQGSFGAAVVDRIGQLRPKDYVVGIDFGGKPLEPTYLNRRAEMWWSVLEWLKGGGCLPPIPKEHGDLPAELSAPHQIFKNDRGLKQLESKEEMRSRGLPSPDLGDALALTFAEKVSADSRAVTVVVRRRIVR